MQINAFFENSQVFEYAFRLILACGCGACIGLERTRRLKEAGIRTHVIVCCASALLMILSKYGFSDVAALSDASGNSFQRADSARIAAQVVSGISFLGAGVIIKHGNAVKGLTTAAGIWATSAIGLTIGGGLYGIAIFVTLLLTFIMFFMHRFKLGADAFNNYALEVTIKDSPDFYPVLHKQLEDWGALISDFKTTKLDNNTRRYEFALKSVEYISMNDLTAFMNEHEEVLNINGSTDHFF